jgi:drug/metabolite transporter (DMT)-like permease
MTKNQKNVIKWIIGVIALIIGGFCIVELTGDPQNSDREPLVGIGWLITGLVMACLVFGWYGYQVIFGESTDDKISTNEKVEAGNTTMKK